MFTAGTSTTSADMSTAATKTTSSTTVQTTSGVLTQTKMSTATTTPTTDTATPSGMSVANECSTVHFYIYLRLKPRFYIWMICQIRGKWYQSFKMFTDLKWLSPTVYWLFSTQKFIKLLASPCALKQLHVHTKLYKIICQNTALKYVLDKNLLNAMTDLLTFSTLFTHFC